MTTPDACPACGGGDFAAATPAADMYTKESYALARCGGCGLLRTEGEVDAASYHYAGGADAGRRFVPSLEPVLRALRRARLRAIVRGRRAPGRVLDIGCGRGVTLAALAARGWEVIGTEVDAEVAASARARLGTRVHTGDLRTLDLAAASFDRIVLWHVLEHLADPAAILAECARLLRDEGRVIVAVPNLDSWQARLGGRAWLHLDVPRHRWHFTPETLGLAARRAGLALVGVDHFSLEYGPFGWLQTVLARAGLGHLLFTDILRPGRRDRLATQPLFWLHVAAALPIAGLAAGSVAAEAVAAACHAGGAVVATFAREVSNSPRS